MLVKLPMQIVTQVQQMPAPVSLVAEAKLPGSIRLAAVLPEPFDSPKVHIDIGKIINGITHHDLTAGPILRIAPSIGTEVRKAAFDTKTVAMVAPEGGSRSD